MTQDEDIDGPVLNHKMGSSAYSPSLAATEDLAQPHEPHLPPRPDTPDQIELSKVRIGDLQIWIMSIYFRPKATRIEFEIYLHSFNTSKMILFSFVVTLTALMSSFQTCGVDSWKTKAFMTLLPRCQPFSIQEEPRP